MSHTITLAPSGKQFASNNGQSILDAALAAGIGLPFGCRNGACRSCRARRVSGEVVYPDGPPEALSAIERGEDFTLLCRATAAGDVTLEVDEIDPSGQIQVRTLPLRLARKTPLAHDVLALELELPANERLAYRAGQYIDILLRDGRRRAFSIANPPGDHGRIELHVRLIPDGSFSGYAADALRERSILRMHGPLGSFYLREPRDGRVVFVTGGTGFAPVNAMIEDALERGIDAPMHLYCGARTERDLYMDAMARDLARRHENLAYVPVLSEPGDDGAWTGRTGLVHRAVLEDHPDLADADIYLCGPPAMIAAGSRDFAAHGASAARIHCDSFDFAFETGHDG